MKKRIHILAPIVAICLPLLLAGCGGGDGASDPASAERDTHPLIASALVTAKPPAHPVSVVEARKSARPGDEITVAGRIAGADQPFADGFASLVLADDTLETCDRLPDDACPTPWDACCVPQETLRASRLSVQVTGDGGLPVGQSLRGAGGLSELDEIVVTGTVSDQSTPDNLILEARSIHRVDS